MATPPPVSRETAHVQDNHTTNGEIHPPTENRNQEEGDQHTIELQATELLRYGSGAGYRVVSIRSGQRDSKLSRFWKRQVCATVEHEGCRDHFGM